MIFLFWRGDSRGLLCQSNSHVMPTLGIEGTAHGEVELSHDFSVIFVKKRHKYDISAVKHSRKKHPNMTETDFCLIPMIIAAADEITKGKYPDTVVYRKTLEKEYYYVECTRTGRKRLAMKTFYKTKIGD